MSTCRSSISDFCDGVTFKDHPLFQSDVNALQIMNPIGTYVKKHKLGCLYSGPNPVAIEARRLEEALLSVIG